ncbi:MAG: hypothetical protein R2695_07220 [Acidimicrobiales bacterium]
MLIAASTQRSIGLVILAIVFLGGLVYLFFNIRAAKPEVGSEIELAANRSPALATRTLEGRRLDLALFANLVMLTVIAIALPFYWLGEPGREDGRNADTARIFTNRGENIYTTGAQCVNCHGAAGKPEARSRSRSPTTTVRSWPRWCGRQRRSTPCCRGSPRTRSSTPSTTGATA